MAPVRAPLVQACLLLLAALSSPRLSEAVRQVRLQVSNATDAAQATTAASAAGLGAVSSGRDAFVMMAFDPPGSPPRSLWGVLPMAEAVRRLSKYPLVLLTNTTRFPDGSDVAASLGRLGVQVLPVKDVPVPDALIHEKRYMPCQEVSPPICQYQFLKLQIWQLTQFDRLIWMDSDAILARSVDSLFELRGTWSQQDNWDCGYLVNSATRFSPVLTKLLDWVERKLPDKSDGRQSGGVCSGFLVLRPSLATYEAIVRYMSTLTTAPGGDQQVIADYFEKVERQPVQLLDVANASFGQCVGKGIPGGLVPAFVHKSDWANSCFHLGADSEACGKVPLGRYWHELFCAAVARGQLRGQDLRAFCAPWPSAAA